MMSMMTTTNTMTVTMTLMMIDYKKLNITEDTKLKLSQTDIC